jgi:hypothetical protein
MTILTAITVVLLWYYSRETNLLRKESEKQTLIQYTPYLSLRNLEDGATISNLGKGIALNIKADDSVTVKSCPLLIIPSIGPGEDRELYMMLENNIGACGVYAKELPSDVKITYQDTLGNNYEASFLREYKDFGVFREISQKKL